MRLSFLFAAYAAVWCGIFAYLVSLVRRHRALERELRDIEALMAKREADGGKRGE